MQDDRNKLVHTTYVFRSETGGCGGSGLFISLFVVLPLVELLILLELHELVGFWYTIGLIVLTGVIGASLAKFQGLMTIEKIRTDMAEGRIPAPLQALRN